jgi:hypothetical protein
MSSGRCIEPETRAFFADILSVVRAAIYRVERPDLSAEAIDAWRWHAACRLVRIT